MTMSPQLSRNTQAVLLLTAPLLTGASTPRAPVLTPREYQHVARWLQSIGGEPADLLASTGTPLAHRGMPLEPDRLKCLLERGFQLAQAMERWSARAIWVIGRADTEYPAHVKARLKADAPSVLYGCGQPALMRRPALAIVGSRNASDDVLEYAGKVAAEIAHAGKPVISGGARGVDRAAMDGALNAGGAAVGVLADALERTCMNRTHRNLILEERLLLISPYDPLSRFHVGQAMQRNKLVYALADAGLVMDAAIDEGGTWAGAVEQLSKFGTPIYVRAKGAPSPGLEALRGKGAAPWEGIDAIAPSGDTATPSAAGTIAASNDLLTDCAGEATTRPSEPDAPAPRPVAAASPEMACTAAGVDCAEALYQAVRQLAVIICAKPKSRDAIAGELGVPKSGIDHWLKRLVTEDVLQKETRPARYVARQRDLLT